MDDLRRLGGYGLVLVFAVVPWYIALVARPDYHSLPPDHSRMPVDYANAR